MVICENGTMERKEKLIGIRVSSCASETPQRLTVLLVQNRGAQSESMFTVISAHDLLCGRRFDPRPAEKSQKTVASFGNDEPQPFERTSSPARRRDKSDTETPQRRGRAGNVISRTLIIAAGDGPTIFY